MAEVGAPGSPGVRPLGRLLLPRARVPPVLLPGSDRAVRSHRCRLADGRHAGGYVYRDGAGAAVRFHPRPVRRAVHGWPSRQRLHHQGTGTCAHGSDGRGAGRVRHRRRTRLDDGDRPDRRAARARDRSHPEARRPADPRRHRHGADPHRDRQRRRHGRRVAGHGHAAAGGIVGLLERRRTGPLHPGRLDGAHQAVLPGLHDCQHRLSRRDADAVAVRRVSGAPPRTQSWPARWRSSR